MCAELIKNDYDTVNKSDNFVTFLNNYNRINEVGYIESFTVLQSKSYIKGSLSTRPNTDLQICS